MRIFLLISCLLLVAQSVLADTRRFPAFGFSLDIPSNVAECTPFENGVAFYIDGKAAEPNCKVTPDRRMIIVSAEAHFQIQDASMFAAQQCDYLHTRWESVPPEIKGAQKYSISMPVPSLGMGSKSSWSCLYEDNDDRYDLFVTTECDYPTQSPFALELNCSAWLHSSTKPFDDDLALLRRIIASVKFFPAEPLNVAPLNVVGIAGSCPQFYNLVHEGTAYTLKDPRSGLTLRLENDHRHITATDEAGTVVWRRDPFVDAHLETYRAARADQIHIVDMSVIPNCLARYMKGKLENHFISIHYNSSQFGMLDAKTGNFFYEGRN